MRVPMQFVNYADSVDAVGSDGIAEGVLGVMFDVQADKMPRHGDERSRATVYHFGRFLLCRAYIEAGRFTRTQSRALRDDLDHLVVHLVLRGEVFFSLHGRCTRLKGMDMALCDLSSSSVFGLRRAEAISLIFPRRELELHDGLPASVHGQRLNGSDPVGAVLAGHLAALGEVSRRLEDGEAAALSGLTRDMVLACFGVGRARTADSASPAASTLSRRALIYIEHNLQRPDLSPADVARDVGLSRTQLYRQFGRFGGVGNYIRRRRLRRSYVEICDPLSAHRRIGEIAYSVGFADEAHFSRVFNQAFGLSPRAARMHSRDRSEAAGSAATTASFAEWVQQLL